MKKYIMGIDEVGRAASKRRASPRYIIGIDEVGRGCLAGPVVVCAMAIAEARVKSRESVAPPSQKLWRVSNRKPGKLRDSKKLSAKQRELWFEYFKNSEKVYWAISRVNPRTIDSINISRAANRAALSALKKLLTLYAPDLRHRDIYLDGSLYLGAKERSIKEFSAATITKGDEKIPAISAASIMAKVTRDRLMVRLAKKYPGYGFEIHKGYGTKRHYEALREHGPSEMHRKTFLKKFG